jgi:hypothetical protein
MTNPLNDFLSECRRSKDYELKINGPDDAIHLSARQVNKGQIELQLHTPKPIPLGQLAHIPSPAIGFLLCVMSAAQELGEIPPTRLATSGETILVGADGSTLVVATDDDMIQIDGVASISPKLDDAQTVKFVSLMREALSKG